MRTALVIPALNDEEAIVQVVGEAVRDLPVDVIVVDNGSTDSTAEVAVNAGARVVVEERRGYGYACAAGAAAAAEDVDVLAFIDGDGSCVPSSVLLLLELLHRGDADLVLGARVRTPDAPDALLTHQRLGNNLTSALIRLLYGVKIGDIPPSRAIRRTILDDLAMQEMTFGWPVEMIVKCAKRGYRIAEVPVSSRPRLAGESKVSGTLKGTIMAAYYLLRTTLRYVWRD